MHAVVAVVMLTAAATAACRRDPVVEYAPVAEGGEVSALADLPVPRTEVAGAPLGGHIVVVGGLTEDGRASALVHLYDPDADEWTEGPSLPTPSHHVGMTSAGGRVWVAGGYTDGDAGSGQQWRELRDVWSLGDGESSWRAEPPLLATRGALGLAAAGDALVAIGGVREGTVTESTEVLRGDRPTEWTEGPRLNALREHLAATSISSRVYAIAGRLGSLESNLRSVESWDPRGEGSWRAEPATLAHTRSGAAAASNCVAGGEGPGETVAAVECLRRGEWQTVGVLRRPRHGLAVVALGTNVHVIGGGEQPGLHVSGAHEVVRLPAERRG